MQKIINISQKVDQKKYYDCPYWKNLEKKRIYSSQVDKQKPQTDNTGDTNDK